MTTVLTSRVLVNSTENLLGNIDYVNATSSVLNTTIAVPVLWRVC